MNERRPNSGLRYVDRFLAELSRGSDDVQRALGQHLHWGFHEKPEALVEDPWAFADAAEAMNARILELAEIEDGDLVLDAGCGFGGLVRQLRRERPGVRAIGLNHDIRQIGRASQTRDSSAIPGTVFLNADALRLPLVDRSIDVIVASELLCHLDDASAFFREAGRTLKPGGRLVVADHVVTEAAQPCAELVDFAFGPLFSRLYGRLNCTRTIDDFSRFAEPAGLAVGATVDVTGNTLPNYRFLRRLMRGFEISIAEKRLNDVISLAMEAAARTGAFRYALIRFEAR